uniref:Uncharacterized protein n=1 Tax=Anopheles culicifacies TaxID=139723 RepID=A0A182MB41_9DIPT
MADLLFSTPHARRYHLVTGCRVAVPDAEHWEFDDFILFPPASTGPPHVRGAQASSFGRNRKQEVIPVPNRNRNRNVLYWLQVAVPAARNGAQATNETQGGVCGVSIVGHGEAAGGPVPGAIVGIGADGRESTSKIRLKAGKPRQGSVDDGCKIMIDIKSSPDYLNRSSGGSFGNFSMLFADSSYKSSWGSHSSSQSQAQSTRELGKVA